ncbi:MAG: hypothetical protein NVSMB49_01760 [Ktedonobacteraceae bacterium]
MRTYYIHFAGQSLERLAALSDGIFAVAMTLLVLNIQVPQLDIRISNELQRELAIKTLDNIYPICCQA